MTSSLTESKKTVAILAPTGMLGSAVYSVLKDKYNLILVLRDENKLQLLDKAYGEVKNHKVFKFDLNSIYQDFVNKFEGSSSSPALLKLLKAIDRADYIINCIGITIPFSLKDPAITFFINSAFPHLLASFLKEKLIHITTDCVFSGVEGFPYNENSPKTPVDIYGLSKSLGEPASCLTLRTSIIGRELEGFTGLLEWFLQQNGKKIKGFINHIWNGITTKEYGKICDKIISNPDKFPRQGIYHVFSTTISKYEMLLKFREKYNIDCDIQPDHSQKLNRTLSTVYDFNTKFQIPSFDEMLSELN